MFTLWASHPARSIPCPRIRSIPVLGLIFLKFADSRFTQAEAELAGTASGRRQISKANYQAMPAGR